MYCIYSENFLSGYYALEWSLIEERVLPLKSYFLVIDDLLRTADKQISARFQALLELTEDFILRFLRKVNQHITAHNQMIIRWVCIL